MQMKINWRVLIPSVIVIVAVFWMVGSVRSRSYSGAHLNFDIGSGPVTVSNPSNDPVPTQLVGSGTRSFAVSSDTIGLSGPSVRQSTGGEITQVFELNLPPGESVFTVSRGNNVTFGEQVDTHLVATLNPLSEGEATTTVVAAVVVILGALFYISRATHHRWMNQFRRKESHAVTSKRLAERLAFKRRFDRVSSKES
jgi:hypothetical protein